MNMLSPQVNLPPTPHAGALKLQKVEKHAFEVRAAIDSRTRRDAYRLRHLCYASKGYIDPLRSGEFSDAYDAEPNNVTLVIYEQGIPVGSIRVCSMAPAPESDPAQLPLFKTFGPELTAMIGATGRAIELNRLVCHPDWAQRQNLIFALMRVAHFVVQEKDWDFITVCVRDNHMAFWKRMRFTHVAGPRLYAGLKFETNMLAGTRARYDVVRRIIPLLHLSPEENDVFGDIFEGHTVPVYPHA